MNFRPVRTPREDAERAAFSFDRMIRSLDQGNELREAERKKAFAALPLMVRHGRYPEIRIERARRYRDSIALVQEEEVRLLYFWTRIRENALDLSVHQLGDLADELEYFVDRVVAGDSFVRISDSQYRDLTMRCSSGRYELTGNGFAGTVAITLDLFQMGDLIALLRSIGTGKNRWRERHQVR